MSFICSVCHEALTTNPDEEEAGGAAGGGDGGQVDIVSTKCGHLYHLVCLTRWFNSQGNPRQECPNCHTPVGTNGYQRIFPAGDEGTDRELAAGRSVARQRAEEMEALRQQNNEISKLLARNQKDLEDEAMAHDLLKMELAVKLSEMDQLSERLRDQVATRDDLVESNMKLQKAQDALLVEKDCLEKSNETTQTQLETLEATLEESEVSKNELATEIGRLKAENLTMTEKVAELKALLGKKSDQASMEKACQTDQSRETRRQKYEMCKDYLENAQNLLAEIFVGDTGMVNNNNNTIGPVKAEVVKDEPNSDSVRNQAQVHDSANEHSYALDPTKMKTEEEETPIEPIKIEPIPLAPSAAASASLSPEVILIEDDDEDTKQEKPIKRRLRSNASGKKALQKKKPRSET